MNDDLEDVLDEREQCESCGHMRKCEHLEGFGRDRVLCRDCLADIFDQGDNQ